MEPRNPACAQEADAVRLRRKAATKRGIGLTRGNESGVEEQGMSAPGSSEELGRPDVFHGQEAEGSDRMNKLQARKGGGGCWRSGRLSGSSADTNEMSRTVVTGARWKTAAPSVGASGVGASQYDR
jgi:hypothetical protein